MRESDPSLFLLENFMQGLEEKIEEEIGVMGGIQKPKGGRSLQGLSAKGIIPNFFPERGLKVKKG
ncbi:hypothetical protein J7L36_02065 [bacterium]|nr:hypothetical protein [bacterium]